MGRLLTVFLCVVTMLLLTVWETEQVSVGPMEVRLVGGATTREGRLEVRINNDTWGTVCNNSWTTAASSVVCRQLGLGEQGQAVSVTQYGEGTGSIWLDDVSCLGSESNLGQCSSQPWGRHNCSHNEDVGIVCYEFPAHSVRLFNDSTNWGLVEVHHRGVWGFVCEDSNWTDAAARVVCKELGFSGGGVRFGGPETNQLYGSVWVNGMNCTGNETSLEQCVVEPWRQTENCQRPARVLCSSTSAPEVRLAGGGSSYGRVEILMDGQTYSVCDNGWNASAATVVCRLLGYQSGQPARRSYYGAGTGQVALDRVACRTSDTSLLACRSSGWLETEAACGDHSKDAGVICFDKVQLIGGDHSTGILLVTIDMTTYVLCDLGLAHYTISTACWELGFEHGYALRSGAFGFYDASYPLRTIDCLRGMRTISSCLNFPIVCNTERRLNYASIYCFNGSRSSDFSVSLHASQGLIGNSSGRLVVSQGGIRGRVCPDDWDDVDAGVVCRQLGYSGGVAQAVWDAGTGPYLLVNVACTGVETSIFSCQSSGVCFLSYENPLDVGVACFNDTSVVVQLVGGRSDKEGLVQVVYGSQVGTVCVPDTYNRNKAARVVCIQLGYKDGKFRTFPRGTGTVSMSEVICTGYERSVFMCHSRGLFVPPSDRCANHDFDLGVRCSDGERLANPVDNTNNSITGVVQINRGSDWINMCNDFFDDLDAQVVCRSEGYSYSRVLPKGSMAYPSGNVRFVAAVNCNGTEASLLDCPVQHNINCSWGVLDRHATVFCSQTPVERGLQAAPITEDGHVAVMADGVKSYLCRDNWDDAAASVYCKDLGYKYGVAIYQTSVFITWGVAAYFVDSVHCIGNETSLSECSFSSNWSTCATNYRGAAQALCHNYTSGRELRLTGGTTSNVGQVEVGFNGVWGTVCDNDFTNVDATAVCLTLGYFGGVTSDNSSISSRDQSQTGPFYLYGLSCSGSETSLWQCPVSNFSVSSNICSSPSYIPRVRCMGQSEVKLVENAGYGAVQVPINTTSRTYGLVCDDNFTDREASVACRDLGYPYGIHLCCSAFGYKSLPIVRSGVRCTGSEALFSDCYYNTRTDYCLSGKYASIVCSNIPPGRGYTVQIDTVSRGSYGRVKVQHMGYWGFVCPNGFDHNDANVICREVGYNGGWAVVDRSYDSSSLRWLSNIDCDGSESHLTRCRNLAFGNVSDCGNTGIAAVYCNREADTQLRLVNGTQTTGRVEVSMDYDNSGSICSAGWTDVEAAVACKSMGFRSGRFLGAGIYGQGSSYLLFTRVDCTRVASSQSLLDCDLSLRDLDNLRTPCLNSTSGPAVQCFEHPVRLTGTRQENYGRVEVYTNDTWTAVCDQGFDQTAAQVACRALGLLYARRQCCSALGPLGTGPVDARQIGFKINRCRGDEATLVDCDVSTSVVCPSGKYASVLCSNTSLQEQTLTVRLAGPGGYYGMVEVNRYGLWGPVCNRNWDDRDANATCRGLGYSHGVTFFGNNITETPILVGDFQCSGQETSLAGCSFKDSSEDIGCSERRVVAGVLCSRNGDIKLRLTDGGRNYGRLEVMYEGQWGRVTGSYNNIGGRNYGLEVMWGRVTVSYNNIADVACRHLGFVGGKTAPEYMRRDTVTGQIWMRNIYCKGDEQSLFECSNRWNYSTGSGKDEYVICYNTTRISSGNSLSAGTVQIYYNKRWGSICDDGWSEEDTAVACRDLGYDNGYHLCCNPFGRYFHPIAGNFQCTGREQALSNCSHSPPENLFQCSKSAVSVACYNVPAPSEYTFSLDGGTTNAGEVQVMFMNITGSICSYNWDDIDARVFCRELGFLAGQAFKHHHLTRRPFWMTDVQCTGSERFLRDCPKTLAAESQCSTQLSAGVTCSDIGINYRLAGSNSTYKGRVEVQVNGTWGSVCGYGYDASWAKVVCRMYGFTEGSVNFWVSYPDPPNKRYENIFICYGNEAVPDECSHSGWKTVDDCASTAVSVVCYGDVRIGAIDDRNSNQGSVQFYRNERWYNLCDTGFDDITARRVCQDLEYVDGRAVCCSAYGTLYYQIKLYETNLDYTMRCQGRESNSTDCLRPGGCLSGNYASVICFNSTDVVDEGYRFDFHDNTKTSGQVVVTHLGVAGRICNTFWDDLDARVLCRSRGHQDGAAYHYSQYDVYLQPTQRGPYWISDVNCTGSEASLGDCPFNDRLHLGNCSRADLAGAVCFNDTGIQYRLVSGDRQGAGRVEISVGGLWGTVCDNNWDDEDARVLCRTLNYTDGYAVGNAYYGQGAGPIWLSNVRCKGSERSLTECPQSGFHAVVNNYDCMSHSNDASAVCIDEIKLNLGFNASMGAVVVYLGDAWTLICDEEFNANSAVTACRSLGFPHGLHVRGGVFGRVDAPIGITHVRCTGREPSLLDCTYNVTTSCSSRSYASVVCSREPFVETGAKVRIMEDIIGEPYHGRIDVQVEGVWGAVCAAGFGVTEATVVCKELGFAGGVPYTAHFPDRNKKPILMSDVKCRGDEKTLINCQSTTTSTTSWCDYYAPRAGVLCYKDTSGISYRLVGDTDPRQGRVEMQYDGVWGLVCVQDFVSRAGGPACRSLGHGGGLVVSPLRYGIPPSHSIWFSSLNCQGNESSLPLCTSTGFNSTNHYNTSCYNWRLHVQCFSKDTVITNLRLAGSTTNSSGRVEVFLQGPDQWGTVCDRGWDDFDATVVCNQLGYATGKAVTRAAFSAGQGRIWMHSVDCVGTERRLQDCAFSGFGHIFCSHFNDAGVICSGVYIPPTTVTNTVASIVTDTTVPRESPETSSVRDSTQSQLTQTHSGSYTAAIVVPVFIVAIVIAITVGAIIYGRKVERLVTEVETRPGWMSFGAGGFISHVRNKLKRKSSRGDVNRGTDLSENIVYYEPGLSNAPYDISVLPDKSAEAYL